MRHFGFFSKTSIHGTGSWLTFWQSLRTWALLGLRAMDAHGVLAIPDPHSSYLLLDGTRETL